MDDIYEYAASNGRTRYVIATYRDGRYYAAMDDESRRLTGADAVTAKTVEGLVVNTTTYAHRSSAQRALRRWRQR